jgi:hypothetical protein
MMKTIKHYYAFRNTMVDLGDSLLSPQAWDLVRTHDEESPFYLPSSRHKWVEKCRQQADVIIRARDILRIFIDLGARRVFSVGVGCGWLEYNIKTLSDALILVCGDYAPATVAILKTIASEFDDIIQFDISASEWPDGYDIFLLHRVDMDISNESWGSVFERMSRSDARYVLFVPCGLLTLKTLAIELAMRARAVALRNRTVFSGYLRTRETFRAFWQPYYYERGTVSIGDLPGFILERSRPGLGGTLRPGA